MLNTLHDGPFSQMKEQGDIHVHHYQKGENPDDKKPMSAVTKTQDQGRFEPAASTIATASHYSVVRENHLIKHHANHSSTQYAQKSKPLPYRVSLAQNQTDQKEK